MQELTLKDFVQHVDCQLRVIARCPANPKDKRELHFCPTCNGQVWTQRSGKPECVVRRAVGE